MLSHLPLEITAIFATWDTLHFVSPVLWAFSTIFRVPSFKRTVRSQRGRLCFRVKRRWSARWYVSSLTICWKHWHWGLHHCERYRGFVRVPKIDFLLQECRVLGHLFLNDWNHVWSVSMTSTNSALDLLKSFASLVFTVFVHTARDMLVDLLCASASVEPVRLDLELMLLNTVAIWLRSSCQTDFALLVSFQSAVFGFRLHLHCLLDLAASLTILTTAWLRVPCSPKVFSSFMRLISDRIVSWASCDSGISIFFWTFCTGILLLHHSLELLLRHLFFGVRSLLYNLNPPPCFWIESETSPLLHFFSTWTVGFVSAPARDRQPCWWTVAEISQLSSTSFGCVHVVQASSLRRSLPKSTVALALRWFGNPTLANLAHKMAEPNKPRPAKTCRTGCVGTFTGTSGWPQTPCSSEEVECWYSDWARHQQQVTMI